MVMHSEDKQTEVRREDSPSGRRVIPPENPAKAISRILAEARSLLDMEIAFVSEFTGDRRVFRFLDGQTEPAGLEVDGSDPLEDAYCSRVVAGVIPCLIPDAQSEPGVADMAVTRGLGVGGHISVPIIFSDGRVYGTFCCFSQVPSEHLNQAHVSMLRAMADLVTEHLERDELKAENRRQAAARVCDVLDGQKIEMVFQPIVELCSSKVLGMEALARFQVEPSRTPDVWFEEAWTAGHGVELELAAVNAAAAALDILPPDYFLSINISPETALSQDLLVFLAKTRSERIVLELTEHSRVAQYGPLRGALDMIRGFGARIAIDDVGTGYAGLEQLLELRPDILKLDLSITRGIDSDPLRHSLAASVAQFASEADLWLIAEGIETAAEAKKLSTLGINLGQGYHYGRPIRMELF